MDAPVSDMLVRVSDESDWMSKSAAEEGVAGKSESMMRMSVINVKEELWRENAYSSTFDPVMHRMAGFEREQDRMVSVEDEREMSVLSLSCSLSELRRKRVPSLTNHDDPTAVARVGQGVCTLPHRAEAAVQLALM